MSTRVRTWCRAVAGLRSRAAAISRLVSGSSSVIRRMRSRTVEARARASASVASRRSGTVAGGMAAVSHE
ncbi:hypothetical protein BJF81_05325 [Ornithinimicrobium sp. CNJ-824]|nr:hypothetical protein BJF81_05325 [Ornithinimicrobium sp. CNJ-824]